MEYAAYGRIAVRESGVMEDREILFDQSKSRA